MRNTNPSPKAFDIRSVERESKQPYRYQPTRATSHQPEDFANQPTVARARSGYEDNKTAAKQTVTSDAFYQNLHSL